MITRVRNAEINPIVKRAPWIHSLLLHGVEEWRLGGPLWLATVRLGHRGQTDRVER